MLAELLTSTLDCDLLVAVQVKPHSNNQNISLRLAGSVLPSIDQVSPRLAGALKDNRMKYKGFTISRSTNPAWAKWAVLWPGKNTTWHTTLASAKEVVDRHLARAALNIAKEGN